MSSLIFASCVATLVAQTSPLPAFQSSYMLGTFGEQAFGSAVALEGSEMFIGAPGSNATAAGAGSVRYLVRETGGWDEQLRLEAWDLDGGESFGEDLDCDADLLAVGAPGESVGGLLTGAVYVFARSGSTWVADQKLTATSVSGAPTLGRAVALSGDTLAAVGQSDNGIDAVFVFERQAGAFVQVATIEPHSGVPGGWSFVSDVDLVGDLLAAGAPSDFDPGSTSTGSASVYRRGAGGAWGLEERSYGSADDWFGYAVGLDRAAAPGAARLAVGVLLGGPGQSGQVQLIEESAGSWSAGPLLANPSAQGSDEFGSALALEGSVLVVGERGDDTAGTNAGELHVFQDSGSGWTATDAFLGSNAGGLGSSVALDSRDFVSGLPSSNGRAFIFELRDPVAGTSYCTVGTSMFGCNVSISATGVASATAPSGFTIHAESAEGQRDGLFFFGSNGRQATQWGNSSWFMCVRPPRVRLPLIKGAGTNGLCNGNPRLDVNALWCPGCPTPQKNPGAGAVAQFQYWFRNLQNTSNQTTGLSDAVEVTVGP